MVYVAGRNVAGRVDPTELDFEKKTKKNKKILHMATGNPATQASRKAPIPAMKPLTLRNGSRCGQGYRIPNPYPHPRDP
jgi:hypothetical protein